MKTAHDTFSELEEAVQAEIVEIEKAQEIFAAFGYVRRKGRRRTKGKSAKFDEQKIMAWLGTEKKDQADVVTHFQISRQSAISWAKKLIGKGLIETGKHGKAIFWKKK